MGRGLLGAGVLLMLASAWNFAQSYQEYKEAEVSALEGASTGKQAGLRLTGAVDEQRAIQFALIGMVALAGGVIALELERTREIGVRQAQMTRDAIEGLRPPTPQRVDSTTPQSLTRVPPPQGKK